MTQYIYNSILMLAILFSLIFIWWMALSGYCYFFLKKLLKKYKNVLRIPTPQSYRAFLRMDFGKWDESLLLKRAFTTFPAKVTTFISFMVLYAILAVLRRHIKLPLFILEWNRRFYGGFVIKYLFNIIEEYDHTKEIDTPIIISNHVTAFDIIYFGAVLKSRVSFVAKKQITKMAIISSIAEFIQTINVDRRSKESKQQTVEDIKKRVIQFEKDPKRTPSVLIFPEETVSNGRHVMSFKNGAFENLTPVTIFCLHYESKQYHVGDVEIGMWENAVLTFCTNCTLKVKKERIDPIDGQDRDSFRERCRAKLAEMGSFKSYDVSYRDYLEYEKEYFDRLRLPENQDKSNSLNK